MAELKEMYRGGKKDMILYIDPISKEYVFKGLDERDTAKFLEGLRNKYDRVSVLGIVYGLNFEGERAVRSFINNSLLDGIAITPLNFRDTLCEPPNREELS